MKKITIIMSVSMFLSCGPSANDNELQKEKSNFIHCITYKLLLAFNNRLSSTSVLEQVVASLDFITICHQFLF